LEKVKEANVAKLKKEIIIVDDGSTDGTKEILRKVNDAKVFFHEGNKGKGAAIRTGLQHATGDIVLIQDADLEYNPAEYQKLLEPIILGKADAVYGSRFTNGKVFNKNMYYSHCLGNIVLTSMTNLLYSSNLEDMETCYKVVKKDVLQGIELKSVRFEIEPELTAKILKKGVAIHEVPITFLPRGFHEGKKINWKDGVVALWTLIKYKFSD
ncbi:MAG: glycosyltransferase family 2 protein, partial [Nanoarchaeota archaeon]